jgi:poly(3-hydroxybutyrate) depolymerase
MTPLLIAAWIASASAWPPQVERIEYTSQADGTQQPALFYSPVVDGSKPLLVALHTWSGDWLQEASIPYAEWCIEKGWIFIHPNFRGPNNKPEAAGSDLVGEDILSAVEFARQNAKVDSSRVYLVGASGGGMAALLLAGRAPTAWAGVSAWVPLVDLKQWYTECRARNLRYAEDISSAVGGNPIEDATAAGECVRRSPITYLRHANGVPLDINAGIHDGHTGSISIRHSINAFNLLAQEGDRISPEDMNFMADLERVPPALGFAGEDPLYGEKRVLLRRQSNKVRLTLFEGGHEILFEAALDWLGQQRRVD